MNAAYSPETCKASSAISFYKWRPLGSGWQPTGLFLSDAIPSWHRRANTRKRQPLPQLTAALTDESHDEEAAYQPGPENAPCTGPLPPLPGEQLLLWLTTPKKARKHSNVTAARMTPAHLVDCFSPPHDTSQESEKDTARDGSALLPGR